MAGWTTINQKLSPGGGLKHLQNCDLPPPLKVFAGTDKPVLSSMNRIWTIMGQEDQRQDHLQICTGDRSENNEKLALLKALQLSQTRAREAERKAARLIKERETISKALLKESSHLFAYRQLVRLLELQVSKLRRQQQHGSGDGAGNASWLMALALCLGIAGVGFAFGCRYFL